MGLPADLKEKKYIIEIEEREKGDYWDRGSTNINIGEITKYKYLKTLTLDDVGSERGDAIDIKDNKIKNFILIYDTQTQKNKS